MSVRRYDANIHEFYSDDGSTNVYLKAGQGQNLVINGANPGGSNTQVQFNNSGSFGGDSTLTFNNTSDTLTAKNLTLNGTLTGGASGSLYNIQYCGAFNNFASESEFQYEATTGILTVENIELINSGGIDGVGSPGQVIYNTATSQYGRAIGQLASTSGFTYVHNIVSNTLISQTMGLTGLLGNHLDFGTNGNNVPTTTTRSLGTKIILSNTLSASVVDYAVGISGNVLWNSVPSNVNTMFFRWYGGTTLVGSLSGTGQLTLPLGSASVPSYSFSGDTNTGVYSSGADTINLTTGGTNRMSVDSTGTVNITSSAASTTSGTGALTVVGGVGINGKVVTGNTIKSENPLCFVIGGVVQTLNAFAYTKLTTYWNSALSPYGTGSPPTFSNGDFTITEGGHYMVGFSVMLATSSTIDRNTCILINNTGYLYCNTTGFTPTDRTAHSSSVCLKLDVNDVVSVYVFSTSASATDISIPGNFFIKRLP